MNQITFLFSKYALDMYNSVALLYVHHVPLRSSRAVSSMRELRC